MRPIFAYFRVTSDDSESVVSLRSRITDFADCEGFELSNVFVDNTLSGNSALTALLVSLRSGAVRHVLLPGLDHITRFRNMHDHMRRTLESVTGATVLILPPLAAAPDSGRVTRPERPWRSLFPVSSIVTAPLAAPGNGR